MSTVWTWQMLLGSFCKRSLAAKGSIAVFKGPLCRASQVSKLCKNFKKMGYKFDWECALSEPCELQAFMPKELATQDYDGCTDYMSVTTCGWTQQWNCPGQKPGSEGRTDNDGSLGYTCCCVYGFWNKERFLEAQNSNLPVPAYGNHAAEGEVDESYVGLVSMRISDGSKLSGSQSMPFASARIASGACSWPFAVGLSAAAVVVLWVRRVGSPGAPLLHCCLSEEVEETE